MGIIVAYAAMAALTFVLMARYYDWKDTDPVGSVCLLAGIFWPLAAFMVAMHWVGNLADMAAARLVTARRHDGR